MSDGGPAAPMANQWPVMVCRSAYQRWPSPLTWVRIRFEVGGALFPRFWSAAFCPGRFDSLIGLARRGRVDSLVGMCQPFRSSQHHRYRGRSGTGPHQ